MRQRCLPSLWWQRCRQRPSEDQSTPQTGTCDPVHTLPIEAAAGPVAWLCESGAEEDAAGRGLGALPRLPRFLDPLLRTALVRWFSACCAPPLRKAAAGALPPRCLDWTRPPGEAGQRGRGNRQKVRNWRIKRLRRLGQCRGPVVQGQPATLAYHRAIQHSMIGVGRRYGKSILLSSHQASYRKHQAELARAGPQEGLSPRAADREAVVTCEDMASILQAKQNKSL